jgi:hypothetical protein
MTGLFAAGAATGNNSEESLVTPFRLIFLICGYQLKTCRTNPQKKVLRVDQKKKKQY